MKINFIARHAISFRYSPERGFCVVFTKILCKSGYVNMWYKQWHTRITFLLQLINESMFYFINLRLLPAIQMDSSDWYDCVLNIYLTHSPKYIHVKIYT